MYPLNSKDISNQMANRAKALVAGRFASLKLATPTLVAVRQVDFFGSCLLPRGWVDGGSLEALRPLRLSSGLSGDKLISLAMSDDDSLTDQTTTKGGTT